MRKVVLGMMTTVNGRLDDPGAWVPGVADDIFTEIDRLYETFDTILVGRVTAVEMFEHWPGVETDPESSDTNKSMARKMNTYKKYVFTGAEEPAPLEWNNAELVTVRNDDELTAFVNDLKAEDGGDIHLSGGARLAQTLIRLGLVDEYHFWVHPIVSPGSAWFDQIDEQRDVSLLGVTEYSGGLVGLRYGPQGG